MSARRPSLPVDPSPEARSYTETQFRRVYPIGRTKFWGRRLGTRQLDADRRGRRGVTGALAPPKHWNFDHAPRKITPAVLARCRAISLGHLQLAVDAVRRLGTIDGEDPAEAIASIADRFLENLHTPPMHQRQRAPKVRVSAKRQPVPGGRAAAPDMIKSNVMTGDRRAETTGVR